MIKLQNAIETLSLHAESGLRLRDFADEIRIDKFAKIREAIA